MSPLSKNEMVDALEHTWLATSSLIDDLEPDDWAKATGCPGWSVFDSVAHLVGLERVLMGEPHPEVELPDGLDHVKGPVGQYMEAQIHVRRATPPGELADEFRTMVKTRIDAMRALPESALDDETVGPMGSTPKLGPFLAIRIFDSWAHEQDIRRAVDRPGNLDGVEAQLTLRRTIKGLQAKFAEARPIRVQITGPQADAFAVGQGEPVADLTMGFETYIPLVCGRADADPLAVKIEGDQAAATAFLDGMGITP